MGYITTISVYPENRAFIDELKKQKKISVLFNALLTEYREKQEIKEKHGLDIFTLEDIETYLAQALRDRPDLTPYDIKLLREKLERVLKENGEFTITEKGLVAKGKLVSW
jgi:hypothetical protein